MPKYAYKWVVKEVDAATGCTFNVDGSSLSDIKRRIAEPCFEDVKYRLVLYCWKDGEHDDVEVENGELQGWAPKRITEQFNRIKEDLVKCGKFL
jgi:hypothetical protein